MNSDIQTLVLTGLATLALTYLLLIGIDNLSSDKKKRITKKSFFRKGRIIQAALSAVTSLIIAVLVQHGTNPVWLGSAVVLTVLATVVYIGRFGSNLTTVKPEGIELFRERVLRFSQSWAGLILLGLLLGSIVTFPRWSKESSFLTDVPPNAEAEIYLYGFIVLLVASFVLFGFLNRGAMRKLPTASVLRRATNQVFFMPAIVGLFFALIQTQTRTITLASRYYTIIVLVWMLIATFWTLVMVLPGTRVRLSEDRLHFEEQKRIKKQRKKKKSKR